MLAKIAGEPRLAVLATSLAKDVRRQEMSVFMATESGTKNESMAFLSASDQTNERQAIVKAKPRYGYPFAASG